MILNHLPARGGGGGGEKLLSLRLEVKFPGQTQGRVSILQGRHGQGQQGRGGTTTHIRLDLA